jgi:hypothetical protein
MCSQDVNLSIFMRFQPSAAMIFSLEGNNISVGQEIPAFNWAQISSNVFKRALHYIPYPEAAKPNSQPHTFVP